MARLDTGWHVNPKVLKVGLAGMGLHAWSISYCDHALSDGFVPNGAWPALSGVRGAVVALVRAGLWVPVEDGFRLHDYTEYNRTRAQVAAEQAAKVRAGAAGGRAKAASRTPSRNVAPALAEPLAESKQEVWQKATPVPNPLSTKDDDAAVAASSRARVRGDGGFQPLGNFLRGNGQRRQRQSDLEIPDEVRARLEQPPISIDPDADIDHAHA